MLALDRVKRDELLLPRICFALYGAAVAVSAVHPYSRGTWLTENAGAWVIVLVMAMTLRAARFSNRTYVQGLILLLLHTFAAHFTYPRVPVGEWLADVFELSRNPFDRVVHFAFGLLALAPLRELFFTREPRRSARAELLLTLGAVALIGTGYELIEWASAVIVGERVTADFLGTQGDPWDTQADLACNLAGGLVAIAGEAVLAAVRRRRPLSGVSATGPAHARAARAG